MRAKIIATAAGIALAVGGVGLAQSSFASENTTQSTQSTQTPTNVLQNGREHGFVASGYNPLTGAGLVVLTIAGNHEFLSFTASAISGGLHGNFGQHLRSGADVIVEWITLANGSDLVTRILPA